MKTILRTNAEPMSQSFKGFYVGRAKQYTESSLPKETWDSQKRSVANTFMMHSYRKINNRILTHSQNK